MTTTPPPEEVELDEILDKFKNDKSSIPVSDCHDKPIKIAKGKWECPQCHRSAGGSENWHIKGEYSVKEAKQALLRWREAYADNLVKEALKKRGIDELEKWVGFLETMHKSIPPENHAKIIETWLEAESEQLAALRKQQEEI